MIENLNGIYETVTFRENTSIRLYDNDACENYPPHWHTPLEIIMPVEGSYTIECCNRTTLLREHDIILISPCCLHALYAPEHGKRIIFQPDISFLRNMKEVDELLSVLSPFAVITPEEQPEIHPQLQNLLLDIQAAYHQNTTLSEAAIYSSFLSMLVIIGRSYRRAPQDSDNMPKQHEYTEKFLSICDYISTHCTEDLTLDQIAGLAGFSKYHFSRLFKQFTNVSFYRYLNQKRIAHAEKLLANPVYTVTEVAIHSGFSNLSSFLRMFKLLKNCTPTEFRSMHRFS